MAKSKKREIKEAFEKELDETIRMAEYSALYEGVDKKVITFGGGYLGCRDIDTYSDTEEEIFAEVKLIQRNGKLAIRIDKLYTDY